jgi:hypothetical protein
LRDVLVALPFTVLRVVTLVRFAAGLAAVLVAGLAAAVATVFFAAGFAFVAVVFTAAGFALVAGALVAGALVVVILGAAALVGFAAAVLVAGFAAGLAAALTAGLAAVVAAGLAVAFAAGLVAGLAAGALTTAALDIGVLVADALATGAFAAVVLVAGVFGAVLAVATFGVAIFAAMTLVFGLAVLPVARMAMGCALALVWPGLVLVVTRSSFDRGCREYGRNAQMDAGSAPDTRRMESVRHVDNNQAKPHDTGQNPPRDRNDRRRIGGFKVMLRLCFIRGHRPFLPRAILDQTNPLVIRFRRESRAAR